MTHTEQERIRFTRQYFEDGCLCLLRGAIDKAGLEMSDRDAVRYYSSNCQCSRNYGQDEASHARPSSLRITCK